MPFLKEGEIRRRKKCSEHLKEHVEIDQITNFHEKINWQSLLYRIPLRPRKSQK
jgi:hypothetical protein